MGDSKGFGLSNEENEVVDNWGGEQLQVRGVLNGSPELSSRHANFEMLIRHYMWQWQVGSWVHKTGVQRRH